MGERAKPVGMLLRITARLKLAGAFFMFGLALLSDLLPGEFSGGHGLLEIREADVRAKNNRMMEETFNFLLTREQRPGTIFLGFSMITILNIIHNVKGKPCPEQEENQMKAKFYRKRFSTLIAVLCLMLVVAACGGSGGSSAGGSSGSAGSAGSGTGASGSGSSGGGASYGGSGAAGENVTYPIVIRHALGEAVIEKKPERIATIQWANHDVVLALGVVPVGFSAANYGVQDSSGLLPWTRQKLEELGVTNPNVFQDTDGLDFEAIADANPDVILAAYSGITQEDYSILTQIAPTVAYQLAPWVTTWREQVRLNSLGMGMPAAGEKLIQDTEKLIADKSAQYPQIKGKKATWAVFSPQELSFVWLYTPNDPRGAFLSELGLEYPEGILKAMDDPSSFYTKLSAENADLLNEADILISYGDESLLKALQENPLFGKVEAIRKGAVVLVGDNTPLAASANPNPLSIQYTIDEYLNLIAGAVDRSK